MRDYVDIMMQTPVFKDFDRVDMLSVLNCFKPEKVVMSADQTIAAGKDYFDHIAVVVEGSFCIEFLSYTQAPTKSAPFVAGAVMGGVLSFSRDKHFPATLWSENGAVYYKFDLTRIVNSCDKCCPYHSKMISNIFAYYANQLLDINTKYRILSQRTLRDKILVYLQYCEIINQSNTFEISMNRQQLAQYLSADRTSLSYELGKLKAEQIIDFRKSSFTIIKHLPHDNAMTIASCDPCCILTNIDT